MAKWTAFPYLTEHEVDPATVARNWCRLHQGDAEPLPQDEQLLAAWALFHSGQFQQACEAGLKLGAPGLAVANRATSVHANFLEPREAARLALFLAIAERAQAQAAADPADANAWFWQAHALGRYSRGISVAKALTLGLGARIRHALERAIELRPAHADAHLALGVFHAEVIDKVGPLVGGMTYGAKRETGLKMLDAALALHPRSPIAMIEYADGIVMLEGDRRMAEATQLYRAAAACRPADAAERLGIELAKAELAG